MSYLIVNCTVPSLHAGFLRNVEFLKIQDYPSEEAVRWIKENIKDGERVLNLRVMSGLFYVDKYGINRDKMIQFWYDLEEVSTPEKLREYIGANGITHIMFPYGPKYLYGERRDILKYLKKNSGNEYVNVAEFNMDENYIVIYAVPQNI